MKTAVVSFFDTYPAKSGSGVVCYDFYKSWPSKKKKLFQMSDRQIDIKNIKNIKLFRNKAIFKILSLPNLLLNLIKYFNFSKKNILIVEGPSWVFYSFVVITFFKIFFKNTLIIYRSHSIEYEIRKKNSNKLIALISKICENIVYKYSHISTSVSDLEKNKIFKYYKVKTTLFPNSIRVINLKKIKEKKILVPKKFILFCGSYDYKPNKFAIDYIIKKVLPKVSPRGIKLVLTGGCNNDFYNENVHNLNYVTRSQLKFLYKKSICLFVPLFEGYGTRIKILEALVLGSNILTTKLGIEGIKYAKKDSSLKITNKLDEMISSILFFSKFRTKSYNQKKIIDNYSMEKNANFLFQKVNKILYERKYI
jgi:hypothetical protein